MGILRNILATIGVIVIIAGIYAYSAMGTEFNEFNKLDPGNKKVYTNMWTKLKETGNSADATVWKRQLNEGVSAKDATDAMSSVATELNIKAIGVLP